MIEHTLGFTAEIVIAAPSKDVYAALDLASPCNRYRVRGMALTPIKGQDKQYKMINPELPDIIFIMEEVEATRPHLYHIRTMFPDDQPIGILKGDETSYRLSENEHGHCRIHATGLFFTVPLYEEELEAETLMLEAAVHDDLVRLKTLLEDGRSAANRAGTLDDLREKLGLTT